MEGNKNIQNKSILYNRFLAFVLFILALILLHYIFNGSILPSPETKNLWFYSGIFMIGFSILYIEPYYTSPRNVITNVIPLLLILFAIRPFFNQDIIWWCAVIILSLLLLSSILALTFEDKEKSGNHKNNKISNALKNLVVLVGQGKILYSAVFLFFLYDLPKNGYTLILLILWAAILLIDPKKFHNSFSLDIKKSDKNQIGKIFGVQSKKIFLVKLFEDRQSIRKFDLVQFKYSMQGSNDIIITGIIFDTYLLDQERWIKVLQLNNGIQKEPNLEKNVVYKISDNIKNREKELKIDDFVGVVIDGSNIGKIKFEYSKKKEDLQEGDLLELNIGDEKLFYQVVSGTTHKERLEARNEMGFIEGEAIQLGEWCDDELSFQKYGWVPPINTPIFMADTSDTKVNKFSYPDYKLGSIPKTSLPSVINLDEAISHHTALLGVTGSGKSFLAHEIINKIKADTKVICVDFNKEFITTLTPAPSNIIKDAEAKQIAEKINWINSELEKFSNQQDKGRIKKEQGEINKILKKEIELFFDDTSSNIKVFELPDLSNTTGILDYTRYFFKVLFEIAKERQRIKNPIKTCVVLEEAHTIIPEWNFMGSSDKTSQSLVNSIGQIALQGRKYGIGFLVIAQRTANVSKTVLTQCNTVICFQAFDETSFSFLGNYVGKEMVQTLPNLKQYHAIITGKAVKSNIPMIIDLKRS
ncbi:MAG: DUF87 domain-containing protein [Candidatus Campbellbacteria bacterium]|nr:DUF87 domain-containing protein [Candidatus Campbellbacteria bacterium]